MGWDGTIRELLGDVVFEVSLLIIRMMMGWDGGFTDGMPNFRKITFLILRSEGGKVGTYLVEDAK